MKIAVLGAGGWGTALALHARSAGHETVLWGRASATLKVMQRDRRNPVYLPDIPLPEDLEITSDIESACAGAEIVLMVVPSKALREVAAMLRELPTKPGIIVSCTKGIENGTGLRMTQILAEHLTDVTVAALSGPSHAEEVARGAPTALSVASPEADVALRVQAALNHAMLRVYTLDDLPGMELGGALKNVFAIGAGVCDGLGLGDNSKAALVTRSLAEMIRLGTRLGGKAETFQGLSGVGDLMVTCFSRHSRNRAVGERIGRGESLAAILASTPKVAEGVPTAKSALGQAREHGIDVPVIEQVNAMLFDNRPPAEALGALMTRAPKPEIL